MSSILIFFRGIGVCNNGVKPIHPVYVCTYVCVAHDHILRHARYCAAINHSRAHKRIHPPSSAILFPIPYSPSMPNTERKRCERLNKRHRLLPRISPRSPTEISFSSSTSSRLPRILLFLFFFFSFPLLFSLPPSVPINVNNAKRNEDDTFVEKGTIRY